MKPIGLYKTTIVIWSEIDLDLLTIEDLGRDAEQGESYCSHRESVFVSDSKADPDWDSTEFFDE